MLNKMYLKNVQAKRSLVSLTPLIDVVFILLIFFMLASNFVDWQFIEFNIGESEEVTIDHKSTSVITLKSNNEHYLNDVKMELNSIIEIVRERCRRNINHPVIIRPSEHASLQSLVTVLDEINEFADENVSLARGEK